MNTHKFHLRLLLFAVMLSHWAVVKPEVVLPPLFADGMVLQRGRELRVNGTAAPGEKVTLSMAGRKYTATAAASGRWSIVMPGMKAGGPYEMRINDVCLKDVMVGDVFLCAGQSNMELTVARVMDRYAEEVEGYENTRVRYVKVPYAYRFDAPVDTLKKARWQAMTADNVAGYSALCYFFGRLLQERTGVAVGIVNTSWGGTPVEAWMSGQALEDFPEYRSLMSIYADAEMTDAVIRGERMRQAAWTAETWRSDPGVNGGKKWYEADYDDTDWEKVDMFDRRWATRHGRAANGTHWFRREIDVPAGCGAMEAVLRLGCMVDADSVYVNGRLVGSTGYQYPPRIYKVPAGVLREGRNQITIRLFSYGGRPSFVKEKPYKLICGGREISLEGEWKHRAGAQMPQWPSTTSLQNMPGGLFNGMVHPLRDYEFSGVVWYQGESNVGRWGEYAGLLGAMMKDWRKLFADDGLPFYIVELADFLAPDDPGRAAWAGLRKQQAMAAEADGNAVLIKNSDTGEWNDIHPLDKKTAAGRLVEAVMRRIKN